MRAVYRHQLVDPDEDDEAEETHEWSLHVEGTRGQCSLCAMHLVRLFTLQSSAGLTVLSHAYDHQRQLVAHVRCARCNSTSQRPAEEMLQEDAVLCSRCSITRASAWPAPAPAARALPTPPPARAPTPVRKPARSQKGVIELLDDDDEVAAASTSSSNGLAARTSPIEDESRVAMDAAALRRRVRAAKAATGSKNSPIDISNGRASPAAAASSPASASPSASPPPDDTSSPRPHLMNGGQPKRIAPNLGAARMKRGASDDSLTPPKKRSRKTAAAAATSSTESAAASSSAPGVPPEKPVSRRPRVDFAETFKSGNKFGPTDPSDLFSPFIRTDQQSAFAKQQAKFEQSRRALDIRRALNIEPKPVPGLNDHRPFETGGGRHARAAAEAAGAAATAAASAAHGPSKQSGPFTLPSFFRGEGAQPYTPSERARACAMILAATSDQPCVVLCLPNMQPRTWTTILAARSFSSSHSSSSSSSAAAGAAGSSASSLLSRHYRRLAKLVHPDKSTFEARAEAESAFKILHQAYTQLLTIV